MKRYLNDDSFYVQNEDKHIYEVYAYTVCGKSIHYDARLVAGWDNNSNCYVSADKFDEEIRDETHIVYIMEESVTEYFESYAGFEMLDKDEAQTLLSSVIKTENEEEREI